MEVVDSLKKHWLLIVLIAAILFLVFAPVHCYSPLCKPGQACSRTCESTLQWMLG